MSIALLVLFTFVLPGVLHRQPCFDSWYHSAFRRKDEEPCICFAKNRGSFVF